MADDKDRQDRIDKSVPEDLHEDEQEYSGDTYERSVPTSLGADGVRGLNPIVLVLAIVIGVAIASAAIFGLIRRTNVSQPVAVTPTVTAQAAAPGIGEAEPTPIVPIETTGPQSPQGLFRPLATPQPTPAATVAPYQPPPQAPPPQRAEFHPPAATASPEETHGDGKMQLEQPPQDTGGSQNDLARRDLARATGHEVFVPIVRDGQVVGVVPETASGTAPPLRQTSYQSGGSTSGGDQASPANPNAQFEPQTQTGSGSGNGNATETTQIANLNRETADEQTRYVKEQQQEDVGYAPRVSRFQLDVTTFLKARLLSKISSDLPGPVEALTTENVYDSATHSVLVVPAGTKLFGQYDNAVVAGQSRLLMAFQRLVFPDGREFVIAGQPGTDAQGAAGFTGDVDNHRGQFYTAAFLLTVLGGAEAAITPQSPTLISGQTVQSEVSQQAGAQLQQLGNKIISQNIQRPPTIIIRPPYRFTVVVTRDLPLDRYQVR